MHAVVDGVGQEKLYTMTQRRYWKVLAAVGVAGLGATACIPLSPGDGVTGPEPTSDLTVTAGTDTPQVAPGGSVTLTATATGGTAPYSFRWDENAGPDELALGKDVTSSALTIDLDPLATAGSYTFRVVVTDSNGLHDTDFIVVQVGATVTVAAAADNAQIFVGTTATATASVDNGTEPFTYQWSLQSGPVELDLSDATSVTLTTEPLTEVGEYVFAVTATDSAGAAGTADVTVEVVPEVTASVPACAIVDEPTTLSASVAPQADEPTILWEVVGGSATIAGAAAIEATLTTTEPGFVELRLTVTLNAGGESPETTTQDFTIESIEASSPRVLIETNFGAFTLELDQEAAPLHVENFLAYVDEGFYDGLLFHRNAYTIDNASGESVPFVLQGGGFQRVAGELEAREPTRDPVESEAGNGLSNGEIYSVALGLSAGDSNSGTSQFFINVADNSFLDDQGFTVFGRVIEGTEVVDDIVAMERTANPILGGEVSLPVEDVIMERVIRACE